MPTSSLIDRAAAYFQRLQGEIVAGLERLDGGTFRKDTWQRPGGGGGITRVLADGSVFEKAGVNFSDVFGELRSDFAASLPGSGTRFRATGISLVLHPRSPRVPTVHANFRRIERAGASLADAPAGGMAPSGNDGLESSGWFGGGADLTPYYLVREDAAHFHRTLKTACDVFDASLYPRFKAWCDEYFFITHRGEPRGIGGVFFDYLGAGSERAAGGRAVAAASIESDPERAFDFVRRLGDAFLPAYAPIVERRRNDPWGDAERSWQLIRRGRYAEFNLVYDRGTLFGLRTDGRVESILMSLPPEARWEYCHEPRPGSVEAETLAAIRARPAWAEEISESGTRPEGSR
jgi:coproporphyrinogen III oxidase